MATCLLDTRTCRNFSEISLELFEEVRVAQEMKRNLHLTGEQPFYDRGSLARNIVVVLRSDGWVPGRMERMLLLPRGIHFTSFGCTAALLMAHIAKRGA